MLVAKTYAAFYDLRPGHRSLSWAWCLNFFHFLPKEVFFFCLNPVGVKGDLLLLDTFIIVTFFPGGLSKWRSQPLFPSLKSVVSFFCISLLLLPCSPYSCGVLVGACAGSTAQEIPQCVNVCSERGAVCGGPFKSHKKFGRYLL